MKCEHKWSSGSVIWENNKCRIKTKCDLCGEDMIVDFKNKYDHISKDQDELNERMKDLKRR